MRSTTRITSGHRLTGGPALGMAGATLLGVAHLTGVARPAAAVSPAKTPTWVATTGRTVHLTLISGWDDANAGFNFDGAAHGRMVVTAPLGDRVIVTYTNAVSMPHDVDIVRYRTLPPSQGVAPAFRGATTYKPGRPLPGKGLLQTASFVADKEGCLHDKSCQCWRRRARRSERARVRPLRAVDAPVHAPQPGPVLRKSPGSRSWAWSPTAGGCGWSTSPTSPFLASWPTSDASWSPAPVGEAPPSPGRRAGRGTGGTRPAASRPDIRGDVGSDVRGVLVGGHGEAQTGGQVGTIGGDAAARNWGTIGDAPPCGASPWS